MSGTPGFSERLVAGWVSLRDVLTDAERRLAAAGVPSPRTDAAILASHVTGIPRTRMLLHDEITSEQRTVFERLLSRRMARVPLQHLLGVAAFRHLELAVGPGVFVPRPETELLAEAGIAALAASQHRVAVDLCTGSGAVALALATEVDNATVRAVEIDPAAAQWAERNLDVHRPAVEDRGSQLDLVVADATRVAEPGGALVDLVGRVDVVTTNPPYIPEDATPVEPEVRDHEPRVALFGGPDGLDVVRGLLETAALLLRPGGVLVVEHAERQGEAAGESGVPGLLRDPERAQWWSAVRDHLDLTRRPRYTSAVRTAEGIEL